MRDFSAFSLKGKTLAVLGDSISTHGNGSAPGCNAVEILIQPEDVGKTLSAYLTLEDVNAGLTLGGHHFTLEEIGQEITFTPTAEDIGKMIGLPRNYYNPPFKTWWMHVQEALACEIIPVCWSGSSICSHEQHLDTQVTSHAWHDAQIRKCGRRVPGSMERIAPDVIVIYRGTNDMNHRGIETYARLTKDYFDAPDFRIPETDIRADGSWGFKEAYTITIAKLRKAYPCAKIFLCTLNTFKRVHYEHFPVNNGFYTLPQLNNAIREIADYMGCGLIELDKDGITFENCYSEGFITDSPEIPVHPSEKGQRVMGLKAIADLLAQYSPLE